MNELPMFSENGRPAGKLRWKKEGLYVEVEALTEYPFDGIGRAYLRCEGGERLLGVMEPCGGIMRCRKRFAEPQLRPLGRWQGGILRCGVEPCWSPYAGEVRGEWGKRLSWDGVLTRKEGALRLAALPYPPSQPFPLTELFCLAEIREIAGQRYVVYAFSEQGEPVLQK